MIGISELIFGTDDLELRESKGRFKDCRIIPNLEEISGADILVSPVSLPVTEHLLKKHLDEGAILVQFKRGFDLPSSIIDGRLTHSLARMRQTGATQSQCLLLFIGRMWVTGNQCFINGSEVKLGNNPNPYWAIQSALSHWNARGGVIEFLDSTILIPEWLERMEERVKDYAKQPVHKPFKKLDHFVVDDPLQDLDEIRDWRVSLLTIPGLGPKRILKLYDYMEQHGMVMSLTQALIVLTDRLIAPRAGIPPSVIESARAWYGIDEEFDLCLQILEV